MDKDALREIAEQKEKEWRQIQEQRCAIKFNETNNLKWMQN